MPPLALTATALDRAGVSPPAQNTTASISGFSFSPADGRAWIEVQNLDSSSHTVTFLTPGQTSGLDIADVSATITAGQTLLFGPFGSVFGYGTDVTMNTDVTVNGKLGLRVYRLPMPA
jgi:hypothetical protein